MSTGAGRAMTAQPTGALSSSPLESPANSAEVKTPIAKAPTSRTGRTTANTRRTTLHRRLLSSAAASAVTGSTISPPTPMRGWTAPPARCHRRAILPPSVRARRAPHRRPSAPAPMLRHRSGEGPRCPRQLGMPARRPRTRHPAPTRSAASTGLGSSPATPRFAASGRAQARTNATATSSGDSGVTGVLGVGEEDGADGREDWAGASDAVPTVLTALGSAVAASDPTPSERRPTPATSRAAPITVTARFRQDHRGHRHHPTSRMPFMTHQHPCRRPRHPDAAWRRFERRRRSSRSRHRRLEHCRRVPAPAASGRPATSGVLKGLPPDDGSARLRGGHGRGGRQSPDTVRGALRGIRAVSQCRNPRWGARCRGCRSHRQEALAVRVCGVRVLESSGVAVTVVVRLRPPSLVTSQTTWSRTNVSARGTELRPWGVLLGQRAPSVRGPDPACPRWPASCRRSRLGGSPRSA